MRGIRNGKDKLVIVLLSSFVLFLLFLFLRVEVARVESYVGFYYRCHQLYSYYFITFIKQSGSS